MDYSSPLGTIQGAGMGYYSTKGTFEPEELGALKTVFDDITSQAWFEQTAEAREGFAKYLFETFPPETFSAQKHRSIIEASARMFYSCDHAD